MDDLKKRLQKFEFLSTQSKIELWLCYRDLKPVSAFPLISDFKDSAEEPEILMNWIRDAGMLFNKDNESKLYIVSKDLEKINSLVPIVFSNTKQDIITKCRLYGYPKETALATYRNFSGEKDGLPKGVGIKKDNGFGISWWPYVRYVIREGFEHKDSLIAKKWSEEIKKNLPELDKEFEALLAKVI